MAKEKLIGWIHSPLTAILGTRSKVAVLGILWRASVPLPYREVVRRSGLAYGSIDLALRDLLETGLVEELPGEGRERRVQFRGGHRLAGAVANLLQVDADFFPALRVELRASAASALADGLLGAAIVGAVARREETLDGTVDIVLVASDEAALQRSLARFESVAIAIRGRFGPRLNLIGYALDTARAMWRTRTARAEGDVAGAELLAGKPLRELLET
jgi:DNA-binding transcriptional ArsR family regulator